jgi:DNA-binding MurR/RpiR family transcriptional regulator
MTDHPLQNLEELRQKYVDIVRSRKGKRFGVRSLHILKMMLDAPNEAAVASISEIAEKHNTSSSTVTRLAQRLGFDGFPEFQAIFRQPLREGSHFYSAQVQKFLQTARSSNASKASTLRQIAQEEWGNVMMTLECYEADKFGRVTKLLVEAQRIFTVGLRGSYPLAFFLVHYLKMIRDNVSILGAAGHTLAEDLVALRPGDLLFAVSVKPYTKETVNACRIAKEKKVEVVVMTDSYSSPLATETENSLIISTRGDYFFSPITTAIIYIEGLLSEVVKILGNKAVRKLKEAERLLEKLEIEIE